MRQGRPGFVRDLLMGPNNLFWELGRFLATGGFLSLIGGQAWNMYLRQPIDLGPGGLGGGLAALFTAATAFILAKDHSSRASAPEAVE